MKRLAAGLLLAAVLIAAVLIGRRTAWLGSSDVPEFRRKGPADAPAVLLEFSDFECGRCAEVQPFLKQFLERHSSRLRLVFRHKPLRSHKWAELAARASDCAGVQGKFWEYAEVLYARQKEWSAAPDPKALFAAYAKNLGLDVARFEADLASGRWDRFLQNDVKEAEARGVTATPTFFINERRMVGQSQLTEYGERYVAWETDR
jgi:protein-disulfide isomerase